jgi:hypothetical protein
LGEAIKYKDLWEMEEEIYLYIIYIDN